MTSKPPPHRVRLLSVLLMMGTSGACQRHRVQGDDTGTTTPAETEPEAARRLPCGLTQDLESPQVWEGDTIRFSVRCAINAEQIREVTFAAAPEALVLDPLTGVVSWLTDGRDGGRRDLTLVAPGPSGLPETLVVPVWIADNPNAENASAPDPMTYAEEWGLPVVHVLTSASPASYEQRAQITVRGTQVQGWIKLRGATSLAYPKNSYTLDFDDEMGVAEWEGGTRGHMVLTSTFDDNSYVRQKLVYDVWREMAIVQGDHRLTPRTFFTVLYVNGVYTGLYLGSDRVDDEFIRQMGLSGDGDLYP
jgi:spore coat protein H